MPMRRRNFIAGLVSTTATWSLAAHAQQSATPVIGFLGPGLAESDADRVKAFRQGLSETGFMDGQNLTIEYRWAEGHYDRLPALATELVGKRVSVIVTANATAAALAAKAATSTIPIVFIIGGDPV